MLGESQHIYVDYVAYVVVLNGTCSSHHLIISVHILREDEMRVAGEERRGEEESRGERREKRGEERRRGERSEGRRKGEEERGEMR